MEEEEGGLSSDGQDRKERRPQRQTTKAALYEQVSWHIHIQRHRQSVLHAESQTSGIGGVGRGAMW